MRRRVGHQPTLMSPAARYQLCAGVLGLALSAALTPFGVVFRSGALLFGVLALGVCVITVLTDVAVVEEDFDDLAVREPAERALRFAGRLRG